MYSNTAPCRPSLLLRCKSPPCSCEKCQDIRRRKTNDICLENCISCPDLLDSESSCDSLGARSASKSPPVNIYSALFDVFGITAFVIMTALTFWATVCYYLWNFAVYIYQSGRKAQIITLALLSIILIGIVYHGIKGHNKRVTHLEIPNNATTDINSSESFVSFMGQENPRQKGGAELPLCKHGKKSPTDCGSNKSSTSLCDLCSKYYKKSSVEKKSSMSDAQARQMFEKFKFYSIPSEWKSPPAFVVFLVDYLASLFGNPSGGSDNHVN
ncbi:uncharacterized protein LOC109614302 [Musca domestica]|uniref:Uncharacterized protein LOC109614302 n=1 Tax=Musca domestica TaxID=7370 RepID=A0A9J7DMP8_MUSDO|nr:uncharacterized protein LOC109614302 [Musca domestica]